MCCLFFPLSKWRHLFFPTSFSSISSCCFLHFAFISPYFLSSDSLPLFPFLPLPLTIAPFHPSLLSTLRTPPSIATPLTLSLQITPSLPLTLSQPHLLDIPALFSCSLQHNFLTHFLSPPWPPDQSLQDGIALGRGEGAHEMRGWRDPSWEKRGRDG